MILGLTGNIASGKSTIARELGRKGATIVDSDQLAREVVRPGSPVLAAIAAAFGDSVLTAAGELDRDRLGALVFADSRAREKLNGIIHPAIAQLAYDRLKALAADPDVPLVVYEAPLLFEVGADARVDKVLFIRVDPAVQLQRLMARNGFSETEAQQRMAAQMAQDEKTLRADYVIDNSGPLEQTLRQLDALWCELVGG